MREQDSYPYCKHVKKYVQSSVSARLEAFFLDNLGYIVTNDQLKLVAINPVTGIEPENWHQRLSELRTDKGYTILSKRDRVFLSVGEYLMISSDKREKFSKRVLPNKNTWAEVLIRAKNTCEWTDGGHPCSLKEGDIDPVGGGTVKLTPDHMTPHSIDPASDPCDSSQWQALCGRHQVMKKNYWDSKSGKINIEAILQAIPKSEKEIAYKFLTGYFNENL